MKRISLFLIWLLLPIQLFAQGSAKKFDNIRVLGIANILDSLYVVNLRVDGTATLDAATLGGKLIGGTPLRGTNSFTTTATSDTVVISGVSASSIFVVSISDATPIADDLLSWTATTDSLFVHRVAGTTAGLSYSYIRID